MAKVPHFEVISLTPLDAGTLRGHATVRISDVITISDIKIIKQDDRPANINFPVKSWTDDTGKRRYSPIIQFHSRDWIAALTVAVLSAWQDFPTGLRSLEEISPRPSPFRQEANRRAHLAGQQV